MNIVRIESADNKAYDSLYLEVNTVNDKRKV